AERDLLCRILEAGQPMSRPSRRRFFQTVAGRGAAAGLGEWAGLAPLSPAIHKGSKALYEALQQAGVKNVVFCDAEGFGHEWQTWRYALHDFAPRLFRPKK